MDDNKNTAGRASIVQYSYEGTPISFSNADGVMVNATQMAKPFGKQVADFLKSQQTKDFIAELADMRKIVSADLVKVVKGGNKQQGTWMHEDVAMEFARWLSPKFAIWTNDRIKELLRSGVATVSDDNETIARAMQVLQRRLDESQARLAVSERENAELRGRIDSCGVYWALVPTSGVFAERARHIVVNGLLDRIGDVVEERVRAAMERSVGGDDWLVGSTAIAAALGVSRNKFYEYRRKGMFGDLLDGKPEGDGSLKVRRGDLLAAYDAYQAHKAQKGGEA